MATAAEDPTEKVWRALADPTRRAILDLLHERPRTTGELTGALPVTRFAVIKHRDALEQAGLVVVRPRGRERWNHLNGVPLRQAYERWMRPYADRWAESLLRLKDAAEQREGATMSGTDAPAIAGGALDVEQEVEVGVPRERVFDALCRMGDWWPHTFREGATVHIEPRVGGRFWEDWGDGDGALYATVTQLHRPERLACSGPMGMAGPVVGTFAMELSERPAGTLVRLSHHAIGAIDDETRASYERGWTEVFDALRAAVGPSA